MSDKKVILVGYSGHGYVVAEAALLSNLPIRYYTEFTKLTKNPYHLEYLGFEGSETFTGWDEDAIFILGLGANHLRLKVAQFISDKDRIIQKVIHPAACIAVDALIGEGSFVARNVSINPLVTIGRYCIINTGVIVEHECTIGDGVHIAPGAVLAGNVTIGYGSFIGANAVIMQGVTIGKNVIIGAGTVVLKDISDSKKVVGNPGREI